MSKNKSIVVSSFISQEVVERKIYIIRHKKVMLDHELANLYDVPTKALNQAVKRNIRRFPCDFMFPLTKHEKKEVVTNCDHLSHLKFSPTLPYAFTELGVAMLSSVLNSERAIQVNMQIMRTFVRLKEALMSHKNIEKKIHALEKQYDKKFIVVFQAIKLLLEKAKKDTDHRRFNL
ncbi:MAG: ORF6N domain-containing protein [Candidatus Omnitrophica bacterium]|nr:ORF6N domain-containing protein [Candidatus Omnitrophota bacterium]